MGGLPVAGSAETFVYRLGPADAPASMLFVKRARFSAGTHMTTAADLKTHAIDALGLSASELEEDLKRGRVELRALRLGDMEAYETRRDDGRRIRRRLTVPGGAHVLVVHQLTLDGGEATATASWDYLIASVQLKEAPMIGAEALRYGALCLLGLLLVTLFAVRLRRSKMLPLRSTLRPLDGPSLARDPAAAPTPTAPPPAPCEASEPAPEAKPDAPAPSPGLPPIPTGGSLRPTLPPSGRWEQ